MPDRPDTWEQAASIIIDELREQYDDYAFYWDPELDFQEEDWPSFAISAIIEGDINLNTLYETLVAKQKDYGHGNIMSPPAGITPAKAVTVRLHDKVARIANLQKHGNDPKNESLMDSYLDIAGYCIILMMLERDWFTLPLRQNPVKPATLSIADVRLLKDGDQIFLVGVDAYSEDGHPVYEIRLNR